MVQILDEEQLEALRCSRCHKYLSVFPVMNLSSRDVTCGRCPVPTDDDGSVRSFLYELVARTYLFKCVNRYEGCRKLLRVDETQAHEKACLGNVFRCPKCGDGVDRSVLGLISHYKLMHRSSYLKKNRFELKPSGEDVMLYIQSETVFLISTRYMSDTLYLNATTLNGTDAKQAFTVCQGSVFERTERRPCVADGGYALGLKSGGCVEVVLELEVSKGDELYDVTVPSVGRRATKAVQCDGASVQVRSKEGATASVSNANPFRVRTAAELEKVLGYKLNDRGTALINKTGHGIDLTCSNCKQLVKLPIYRCVKLKHKICHYCSVWCGICDCLVKKSDADDLLDKISRHLRFPCKWKCGAYFTNDIHTHEYSCKHKELKCPVCPFEVDSSSLTFMAIHLLDSHQILNFVGDYDYDIIATFISKKQKYGKIFFTFHNKCCYFKWSSCGSNYYNLNFGLFGEVPNVSIDIIDYETSECLYKNVVRNVRFSEIENYYPYINFNITK